MKTALKVVGIIFALFIILIIGLNLYLTDDRIKDLILPQVNESIGREVEVDRMSFTLFRTFPNAGVSITNLRVPGETDQDTLASFSELLVAVKLLPLLSDEVQVSRLDIDRLDFTYIVFADGTTNIDFLTADAAVEPESAEDAMAIDLNRVRITNTRIAYEDRSTETYMLLDGLNLVTSLRLSDVIESDIEADLRGLTVRMEGQTYLSALPLKLVQQSVIDTGNETLELKEGSISIRGLDLAMTGSISNWSDEAMLVDLSFNSASDNFGTILGLIPDAYREYVEGYDARGSLDLRGTVSGKVGGEQIPAFSAIVAVTDGYLKHPDVNEPIREIQLSIDASNERVQIERFTAEAGVNRISANGFINKPLDDDADFDMNIDMNMDLGTIRDFYPLSDHGLELRGGMVLRAVASGVMSVPDSIRFDADIDVKNGYLKYDEVDKPVEDIHFRVNATQSRVTIESLRAKASVNELNMTGVINEPMNEDRSSFDLTAAFNLDLSTIGDFYPISSDTLEMRGKLNFDGKAAGRTADAENATVNGSLTLRDGYIRYHEFPQPIEDIVFESQIRGNSINITNSSLRSGSNRMAITGSVTDYMADSPALNLQLNGTADLAEITDFYALEEHVTHIAGKAEMNLRVTGRTGDVENLTFNGSFNLSDGAISTDSLPQPITGLNTALSFSNKDVRVSSFVMNMGSSDFSFSGTLSNYMALAAENTTSPATLTATYRSRLLNVDELYDWDAEAPDDEEFPIELPNLKSVLQAEIDEMIMLGVSITNIKGQVETDPVKVSFRNTVADLFDGKISGEMAWNVPQPERTEVVFNGKMDDVRVEAFFEEFSPMGKSNVHKYLEGGFNMETAYSTWLDIHLDPEIPTTKSDGIFLMKRGTLKNHPMQVRLAALLKIDELTELGIDDIDSKYKIVNGVLTFEHFNLTSRDMGMQLDGTQNLMNDQINYRLSLILPGRFAEFLRPVITAQGVEAITREDGKMVLPVTATGTAENPNIGIDTAKLEEVIKNRLSEEASDRVKDALRGILRRN
ncbi:MAG: AsmA-like C-terminal region-containing protein [Cyclonatronaceae bacterium]